MSQIDLFLSFSTTESRNKFVETCLKFTLDVICERIGSDELNQLLSQGIQITIVGDNDFYSQRAQVDTSLHLTEVSQVSYIVIVIARGQTIRHYCRCT